jgi:glycosyltransferase involved in cell wall biosynthesis
MITYNHESYIKQAIKGVIIQKTNFSYELVIGEDCSKDRTRAICEEYVKNQKQIRLLSSERNLGVMANFIRTLQSCSGKYIAICEGDDYWTDAHKLQMQVDFMESNPQCSLCCHMVEKINYETGLEEKSDYIVEDRYLTNSEIILAHGMKTPTLSYLFRAEYINNLPKWFLLAPIGDIPLVYYLMMKGKVFCFTEIMGTYRSHLPNSWTDLKRNSSRLKSLMFSVKYAAFVQGFNKYSGYKYKEELASMRSQSNTLKTFVIKLIAFNYNLLYQKK